MNIKERKLIKILREMEGVSGNKSLRETLKWGKKQYEDVREGLISQGILTRGKGKGGSVILREEDQDSQNNTIEQTERELYKPLLNTMMNSSMTKDWNIKEFIVEVVAHAGKKQTGGKWPRGGKWTRPDLVMVSYTGYDYVPDKTFEVITFEVKKSASVDVTGVYEALAHRRAATRAYLLVHVPEQQKKEMEYSLIRIGNVAAQNGVGFITVEDPEDYETWEERVEAARHYPPPQDLNDFLDQQLPEQARKVVREWFQ